MSKRLNVQFTAFSHPQRVFTFCCPQCQTVVSEGRAGIIVEIQGEPAQLAGKTQSCSKCRVELVTPQVFENLGRAEVAVTILMDRAAVATAVSERPGSTDIKAFCPLPASLMGVDPNRTYAPLSKKKVPDSPTRN